MTTMMMMMMMMMNILAILAIILGFRVCIRRGRRNPSP